MSKTVRRMSREERGVMARREELHQLSGLNSRLAVLVDRVMRGELEKRRLTRYLTTVQETVRLGTEDMEELYKEQVEELRRKKAVEEARLAEMVARAGVINMDNEELRKRENALDSEIDSQAVQKDKLNLEKKRLKYLISEMEKVRPDEEKRLQQVLEKQCILEGKLAANKEALDKTRIERLETEERLEERKSQVLEEDGEVFKSKKVTVVTEEENGGEVEGGSKVKKLVESFHTGSEIQELHSSVFLSGDLGDELPVLKASLVDEVGARGSLEEEMARAEERLRSLLLQAAGAEEDSSRLRRQLHELEQSLLDGADMQRRKVAARQEDMAEVRARMARLAGEKQALMEVKAGLDLEIAMFHCLVSAEEERLGLTPGPAAPPPADPASEKTPSVQLGQFTSREERVHVQAVQEGRQ